MAKSAKKKAKLAPKEAKQAAKIVLHPWQSEALAILLLFIAVFILFNPIILQNKVFSRGDDTASALAMGDFVKAHEAELGRVPYWCPDIFVGFPSYAAGAYMSFRTAPNYKYIRWINPLFYITQATVFLYGNRWDAAIGMMITFMFFGGVFTYLLLRELKFSRWVSGILGLIMAWNPYYISLATAAHGGKLVTLTFIPLILLMVHRVMERRRLFDIALLAMTIGWEIVWGAHAQVIYYSAITVFVYFVCRIAFEWKDGIRKIGANIGALLIAGIVGLAIGSLWTIPLYSYIPYSIRGMGPAFAQASVTGLTLDWATGWSFHPFEFITFAIPSFFGLKSPYYWGWMPFTSSSFYIGIIPLIFAIIALIYNRTRIVWFCVVLSIIAFLMSLGRHFLPLYKLLFDMLPGFDKFRTPSLIILLIQIAMIIMAAYGIHAVVSGKVGGGKSGSVLSRRFLILAGACGGLLILVLILKSALFSGLSSFMFIKEGETARYNTETLVRLQHLRFDELHRDLMIALVLTGLVFLFISYRLKGSLPVTGFLALLAILTVVDLWIVSHRFFEPQPKATLEEPLKETPAMAYVKKDTTLFRVLPLGESFQDNSWMAQGIQSVGGYQGAKVRRYQDLLDYVLYNGPDPNFPLNHNLTNVLNAKYLVAKGRLPGDQYPPVFADQTTGMVVSENPNVLPRAFFVDTVWVRDSRKEAINALNNPDWDPATVAIVEQKIPWEPWQGDRSVDIVSYGVEQVILRAKVSRPSLLVLADTNYPGNWHAQIDGQSTPIYMTDYLFRSVIVPTGEHQVKFYYRSKPILEGVMFSSVGSVLAAVLLIIGIFLELRRRKRPQTLS
jgi:hypothetical protein